MARPLKDLLVDYSNQVDAQLEQLLPQAIGPAEALFAAMRYSVFNGGKRLRPALCFAAANAIGGGNTTDNTAKVAAAVEAIHAYSLIHDDLPAMDDDDLRRGKPTCHIQFGEATAILAGDALQSLAFQQLTELSDLPAETRLELVSMLSRYAGCAGMVTGQAIDLAATGQALQFEQLKTMHGYKTGALIEASVLMGAIATGAAKQQQLDALKQFASAIGLAFQIQDDILDVESSTEQLGKQQGSDAANNKSTYTSILGLEQAREQAAELYQQSMASLELFAERAEPLRQLASFIVNRAY
ncbi:polyprenyl synthetase family protein [Porticoccaceae bacterium]|nr:polyprenyl synthetase family protein [Porticoccaceae bacterium]MDC0641174.1 polyprenyl synthetase family protein [Porticoccaceae bacterium]